MPGTARELRVRPFLLVLSSPSGGGKSTIARHLLAGRDDVVYSISATTRNRRDGEVDGQHYHFLDRATFQARATAGEFLEWAEYGGNLYGTLRSEVERGLDTGRHVVLDIEVQGAEQLRRSFPNAVHVFVLPPSATELVVRLRNRKTEDEAGLARRFAIASGELELASRYDYVVVNDDLVEAVAHVAAILDVESRRPERLVNLEHIVNDLRRELAGAADRPKPAGAA
ncbi:MAG: guanylate kinase [Gemmatimonadetes bacterium]|nr:guanylate kinase [Gemmatimonadota bacterium]